MAVVASGCRNRQSDHYCRSLSWCRLYFLGAAQHAHALGDAGQTKSMSTSVNGRGSSRIKPATIIVDGKRDAMSTPGDFNFCYRGPRVLHNIVEALLHNAIKTDLCLR